MKVKITKHFFLNDYKKVKAIEKKSKKENEFMPEDIIECEEDMVNYLSGGNKLGINFIEIIEEIKEEKVEENEAEKPVKKQTRKKKKN